MKISFFIIPLMFSHMMSNVFNGTIHINHIRPDNAETREAYTFLNTEVPFDDIVTSYEEVTICGDTLISIHRDQIDIPYSTYIQIKDRLFIQRKDSSYKRIRTQLGIGQIDKFYKSKKKSNQLGIETVEYIGTSSNGETDYILQVALKFNFKQQAGNKYLFSNVFCKEGLILHTNKRYLPTNLDFISVVNRIEIQTLSCKEKIEELNFKDSK